MPADRLLQLALAPALITQALRLRKHALRLPEAAGPRQGQTGRGPRLRLAVIGDSSAAGVGVDHQDQALAGQLSAQLSAAYALDWQLDAQSGATTRSTLARRHSSPAQPLDVVITALGVNDATRLLPTALWARQQKALIAALRARHAPRRIYLCGLPPLGQFPLLPQPLRGVLGRHAARLERRQARHAAAAPDLLHLPFDLPLEPRLMARDGFHPSAELYALWAGRIAAQIRRDFPPGDLPD